MVSKFSEFAWALESRVTFLLSKHSIFRQTWQRLTARLRLSGVHALYSTLQPSHASRVRVLQLASSAWFLEDYLVILKLVIELVPHEHPLAHALRLVCNACLSNWSSDYVHTRRLLALRDLWKLSVLFASLIRRDIRIMCAAVRGMSLTIQGSARFHALCQTTEPLGATLWGVVFPRPSRFGEAWREVTSLAPFPAIDMQMVPNYGMTLVSASAFNCLAVLAEVMLDHWPHHANWPAHGIMLPLHAYWNTVFETDHDMPRRVRPPPSHSIGVEARMLVLLMSAPPEYWFSDDPIERVRAHPDEEAPSDDDSWESWTQFPLPPSPFHLPYRPGARFVVNKTDQERVSGTGQGSGRVGGW